MAFLSMAVTIKAGESLSEPLEISSGLRAARVAMPDAWDQAPLTFSTSSDGTNWSDPFRAVETHSGLSESYEVGFRTVAPGSSVLLPADAGANMGWLRLRSGTRTQPVKQSADREFVVLFES
jgi:hypothetical protein